MSAIVYSLPSEQCGRITGCWQCCLKLMPYTLYSETAGFPFNSEWENIAPSLEHKDKNRQNGKGSERDLS